MKTRVILGALLLTIAGTVSAQSIMKLEMANGRVQNYYASDVKHVSWYDATTTHEYVDMGLSVKWATCNIGASTPEEYGSYLSWGETDDKDSYTWANHKWGSADQDSKMWKYTKVDKLRLLEPKDDAATVRWGSDWRMPTEEEANELLKEENCVWKWTTDRKDNKGNTVCGFVVISRIPGFQGNSIFLPAAGREDQQLTLDSEEVGCQYWTGRVGSEWHKAYFFPNIHVREDEMAGEVEFEKRVGEAPRAIGLAIRPVRKE